MKRLPVLLIVLLFAGITFSQTDHRHRKFPPETYERPGRDQYQKPVEVVEALQLKPTDVVADIGAGSGYFTRRLAKIAHLVYAIDIDETMLRYIHRYVEKEKQYNIVTVLSPPNDPMLPEDSVDLVFICNTLHHISHRDDYYRRIGRVLKNGGRLAIVDYHKKPLPIGPPPSEKLSREQVLKEITAAGFQLEKDFDFLPYQYFLIFRWNEKNQEQGDMNSIAVSYVKLVLALGEQDEGYVDAYYGPKEWLEQAKKEKKTLEQIQKEADELIARLESMKPASGEMEQLRHHYLIRQLQSLRARARILSGTQMSFDEESLALYDAVAPVHSKEHFQKFLEEIGSLLPGQGEVFSRYTEFRKQFTIPKEKLDAVFRRAIKECRVRTAKHIPLPEGESFRLEYVNHKSWSAYNWYQGNFQSLIQVNTDLPLFIDRALDLACHEGYPGHHVYNVLLEKHLVKDRGWVEYSVYPLFSPQSLIAEGTANYALEITFPGNERMEFERNVLFPLAGLPSEQADLYYRIHALTEKLRYAGNEAARNYLNGLWSAEQAIQWLQKYSLMERARAEQRLKFIQQYRSYVINYNLGKDLVAQYLESKKGNRWEEFYRLLSLPRLPSGLRSHEQGSAGND